MSASSNSSVTNSDSMILRIKKYIAIFSLLDQRWGNVVSILSMDIDGWISRGDSLLYELKNSKQSGELNKRVALYLFSCFEFIPNACRRIKPYYGDVHGDEKLLHDVTVVGKGILGKFYLDYSPFIYDEELKSRLEDCFVDLYEISVKLSCGARYSSVEHLKKLLAVDILTLIPRLQDHLGGYSGVTEQLSDIYKHFYCGFK